jgi:hypothetical protein
LSEINNNGGQWNVHVYVVYVYIIIFDQGGTRLFVPVDRFIPLINH